MAASNILTPIRRAEPLAKAVFRNAIMHRTENSAASALSPSPQLVVFFTWIGAKEKYAHKFVESWTRRGFNVLHITTPVLDLVRPKSGTEITAGRVIDFLSQNKDYNIILHGLSVGGYISQRILMGLQGSDILNRISHQIYDSFTHIDGFQSGVENAVQAVNPMFAKIAGTAVNMYAKYADLSCFQAATDYIYRVPTPAPAFFMHSLADTVAKYESVHKMLPYMARGSPVYAMVIPKEEKMNHVSLFRKMGEEAYMSSIVRFLKHNKFSAQNPAILEEEDPNSERAKIYIERTQPVTPLTS